MADLRQQELHDLYDKTRAELGAEGDRIKFMREAVLTLLRGNTQYVSGKETRQLGIARECYQFASHLWQVDQEYSERFNKLMASLQELEGKLRP